MNIPAICNKCRTIFASGIALKGSCTVITTGCTAGPCPNCGDIGTIPDRIYNYISDTIDVLSSSEYSRKEIQNVVNILKKAKKNNSSLNEIKEEIECTSNNPSKFLELLPKTREEKRDDIKFFITTLLAILAIATPFLSKDNKEKDSIKDSIKIEKVIHNVYQIENNPDIKIINFEKINRNVKCPCGSNLKFKKCCME